MLLPPGLYNTSFPLAHEEQEYLQVLGVNVAWADQFDDLTSRFLARPHPYPNWTLQLDNIIPLERYSQSHLWE